MAIAMATIVDWPASRAADMMDVRQAGLDLIGDCDAVLGNLLAHWRSKRRNGAPARAATLDMQALEAAIGWLHIVDCCTENPAGFAFQLFGSRCRGLASSWRPLYPNLAKTALGDLPHRVVTRSIMADYSAAKATGDAAFHEVRARVGGRPTSYARLILPVADKAGRTGQLLVAVNRRPLAGAA
jgi:hypothetical protein